MFYPEVSNSTKFLPNLNFSGVTFSKKFDENYPLQKMQLLNSFSFSGFSVNPRFQFLPNSTFFGVSVSPRRGKLTQPVYEEGKLAICRDESIFHFLRINSPGGGRS